MGVSMATQSVSSCSSSNRCPSSGLASHVTQLSSLVKAARLSGCSSSSLRTRSSLLVLDDST